MYIAEGIWIWADVIVRIDYNSESKQNWINCTLVRMS